VEYEGNFKKEKILGDIFNYVMMLLNIALVILVVIDDYKFPNVQQPECKKEKAVWLAAQQAAYVSVPSCHSILCRL
jgi:hypothetical protein